jgi:ribosomal protein L37E
MDNKIAKCSICGQPIKTVVGAVSGNGAHLTCRRCFGESSYAGSSHWVIGPTAGGPNNVN